MSEIQDHVEKVKRCKKNIKFEERMLSETKLKYGKMKQKCEMLNRELDNGPHIIEEIEIKIKNLENQYNELLLKEEERGWNFA